MKIVLVGAGSVQFGYGTLGDIFNSPTLAGSEITLLDINADALEVVLKTAKAFIEQRGLKFTVTATTDRRAAFKKRTSSFLQLKWVTVFSCGTKTGRYPCSMGCTRCTAKTAARGVSIPCASVGSSWIS